MNLDKYAELFASEAREHLAHISRALIALEAEPGDRESLDAIFRSVHTIKGMAAAMGYDAAAELSHSIENALDAVRAGHRTVDAELVDVLLESGDALEAAVDAAVSGGEASDHTEIRRRLSESSRRPAGAPRGPERRAGTPERATAGAADGHGQRGSGRTGAASRVRVDIKRLDALMNLLGELIIVHSQLAAVADELASEPLRDSLERASYLIGEMQAHVVESRMVPVWQVFDRFPRVVRDVARTVGKEVEIEIAGKELELDRSMLDAISDPLVHVLRNAVDHGIESPEERERLGKPRTGVIRLSAQRSRSRILIQVEDDGRGVDRDRVMEKAVGLGLIPEGAQPTDSDLFRLMARPGFSTAEKITQVSGRGVGLNVVEDFVRGYGGSIQFHTELGVGSRLQLELPLTIAMVRALIVEVSGHEYALPVTFTRASFESRAADVEVAHGREWVRWRDERLPLTRLQDVFDTGIEDRDGSGPLNLVTVEFAGERRAVGVDRLIGEEEIVVKTFDSPAGALPLFSGATVRADGRPALIVDVTSLS